ncbi:MAG: ABC transporter ATP-binding protein [Aestuariivita sp.]|nr:ABC transporter ATP-binding protein [Aestuariivita sp.]MCY4201598.1 ABC transporter ATP-binding protein [Aestuariivita sp.]
MALLSLDRLSLSIHRKTILHGISLNIAGGEIHALTGESGSGKSLTALAIMRLLPIGSKTQGHAVLNGIDVLTQTEAQMLAIRGREVGMIFQEPMTALNPVKTIGSQVQETVQIHTGATASEAARRADDVLARVGLPSDKFPRSRYPHQLSGGQRQRVVIAIAIALRPKLLIADEPTTALDVTTQALILKLLRNLVEEQGMGMLMITHDLAVVAEMAQHISVIRDGEIVEQAATPALFSGMRHHYTQALFEASRHRVNLPAPPAPRSLLTLRNVCCDHSLPRSHLFKSKDTFRALHQVTFDISLGERLGLVGESGCGKSTLARAILGLKQIQEGEILLDGDPVYADKRPNLAVCRRMQVVFQDPFSSFNPRHPVGRLITEPFHGQPYSPSGSERRAIVSEALLAVGLAASDADKFIHEFSGGQRQRIAIARAIITRPDLILFDEAVSALDVSVRARILDVIAELCRSYGLTYLFISHDLGVVRSVTDRVMIMREGRIVEYGETESVFRNPSHPYTRTLIASAPVLPSMTASGY